MAEQWLSIVEYARTYKMSDMTIRRRIKTGRLRAVLKDGKYYIPINAEAQRPEGREAGIAPAMNKVRAPSPSHVAQTSAPILKDHPSAHQTFAKIPSDAWDRAASEGVIPSALRRPFAAAETGLVDTAALLAFCDAALRKAHDAERRQVEKFKAKLEALEAALGQRDLELKNLHQQIEDLQLLVRVLERKQ